MDKGVADWLQVGRLERPSSASSGRMNGVVEVPKTLLVTNDYPPRIGGIQRTLEALVRQLPPDRTSVLAPRWDGSATYDAASPHRVVRDPGTFMWPTPRVAARIEGAIADAGAEVVLFGDAFPLAQLGPRLARRGTPYLVAAHGFDYWLATVPGAHAALRYMTSRASRVPVMCSEFIARRVRTAVPRRVPVSVLYPGADVERFRPDLPTSDLRERHGIGDRPLVVCVSRLVRRKGQDVLIRAMPEIRRRIPEATLLIVGGGPDERRLRRMAVEAPPGSVVFAGQAGEEDLARYYAMADVFAMPCRTRLAGLEVEGWGNVFIEAAACGRPVVVGDSGGARESLVDGETGVLVDGNDLSGVSRAVADLLSDPDRAREMGKAGRARVERDHTWPRIAERLAVWLSEAAG
jgi:phosphatidylinositol alpha-1,6-mannosyltransferase